jgi:O-antigen/teichoic acid export membrane protein
MAEPTLTQTAVRGMVWTNLDKMLGQAIFFIRTIVLARLLVPADFGIVAMATIVIGLVGLVNELGLAEALIQRADIREKYTSTAFWTNLLFSTLLAMVTFIIAPLAALFFRQPELELVLRVIGLNFVIGALGTVHRALFTRAMRFRVLAIVGLTTNSVTVVLSIGLAWIGFGYWSIIIANLAGSLLEAVLMWSLNSWRPRLMLVRGALREMLGFSLNLLGARTVVYAGNNIGSVLLGRGFSPGTLGVYSMASNIPQVFRARFTASVMQVLFPAFASIQQDDARMQRGYQKTLLYVSLLTFPGLTWLLVTANEFVLVVYGPKWAEAVVPMQILTLGTYFTILGNVSGPVQKARGRSDYYLYLAIFSATLSVVFTLFGIRYGLIGIASALALKSFIAIWPVMFLTSAAVNMSLWRCVRAVVPAIVGSVAAGTIALVSKVYIIYLLKPGNLPLLIGSLLLFGGSYGLVVRLISPAAFREAGQIVWTIARPYIRAMKARLPGASPPAG